MLYECVECGRKISETAQRCPGCGTHEAGGRAVDMYLRVEALRRDPSYQERLLKEQAKAREEQEQRNEREAAEKAKSAKETDDAFKLILAMLLAGAIVSGLMGWKSGSVIVCIICVLVGGFLGMFFGGILVAIIYK
jgi:predicted ATP-dependent serine protease